MRVASLVASSVVAATLSVPLSMGTAHAALHPVPAISTNASAGILRATTVNLAGLVNVADIGIGVSSGSVNPTDPRSVADAVNLTGTALGGAIPLDILAHAHQEAPPDNPTATSAVIPSSSIPGVLTLGVSNASASARWNADNTCLPAATSPTTSTVSTADAEVLPVAGLPGGGAALVALPGTVSTTQSTSFVSNGLPDDGRDVVAKAVGSAASVHLLGDSIIVDVASAPMLTAKATGVAGGASTTWTAPLVTVTANGTPQTLPVDGSPLNVISPDNPLLQLELSLGQKTNEVLAADGTSASADATVLHVKLVLLPALPGGVGTEVATVDLFPFHVSATAPVGGLVCGVPDTTAPDAPVITSPANGSSTNDTTPAIGGTAEPASTVTVYDTDGTTVLCTATTDGAGNWTCTPASPMSEGSHTITATATDDSSNTSAPSAPVTFTIDTVAPEAPVITTPADGSSTNDTTPPITGTAEANSTVTVYDTDGTTVLCTGTADASGNWTCTPSTPMSEGSHSITATSTDAAGNVSPASAPNTFTIDTVAPAAPVITAPANGSTTTDSAPAITGTAEAGSTVTVTEGNMVICTAVTDAQGFWTCTPSVPMADGSHTIVATATDAAGNVSPASAPDRFTIDSAKPAAPVITSPTNASSTNDSTPPISGTAEPGSTVTVTEGETVLCTALTDGTGHWTCTPETPLGAGPHTITATATDGAGNVSNPSAPVTFKVDTVAPAAPVITSPTDGSTTGDSTPPISGTAEPGSDVVVTEGGTVICTATTNAQGSWTCTPTTPLPDGDHTITATATDDAGNTSPPSAPVTFGVDSDLDDDGLTNTEEQNTTHTDPLDPDTDNDGLTDGQEVHGYRVGVCGGAGTTFRTNPLKADTDADGLNDGREATGSLNTKYGSKPTNPKVPDTDGDGLKDGPEVKGFKLGLTVTKRTGPFFVGNVKTNACKVDTDGDGLSDRIEKVGTTVNQRVRIPKNLGTYLTLRLLRSNPTTRDTDNDGLPDRAEVTGSMNTKFQRAKSDPAYWDTDRGGVSDGEEVRAGSNPANVLSTPEDPRMLSGRVLMG